MSKRNRKPSNGEQLHALRAPEELTFQLSQPAPLNEQDVASLAYQRWVERGCPQGSSEEDWFEAERELQSRGSSS